MDKLSIWMGNTPIRRWQLERVTKKYYSEYFKELRNRVVLEIGCGSAIIGFNIIKYIQESRYFIIVAKK